MFSTVGPFQSFQHFKPCFRKKLGREIFAVFDWRGKLAKKDAALLRPKQNSEYLALRRKGAKGKFVIKFFCS
jgi:hypothetical protein